MARPAGSEVHLALNWFAWWRIEQEFEIGGEKRMSELSREIGKTELSNIRRHQRGVGPTCLRKLAPALGTTPGQFTDAALSWWPRKGLETMQRELERRAREARQASDSGTMRAVSAPPSDPTGSRKAN